MQELKKELPKLREALAVLLAAPEPPSGTASLPPPSLTEPFEIGEALYDQGRVANAVVSLLELMRIGVVPDANASTRATAGITLSESEVRALIDLAREDLAAAENDVERLPHTFTDLHAGIADLLPGVSVDELSRSAPSRYRRSSTHSTRTTGRTSSSKPRAAATPIRCSPIGNGPRLGSRSGSA